MSITNSTEEAVNVFNKYYNSSSNIIEEEEAPLKQPTEVVETTQTQEKTTQLTKEEEAAVNVFNKYYSASKISQKEELGEPLPEPSLARQIRYGFRQEPFLITSAFRLGKAGLTAAFDPDRTYEEVRAEQEEKRQRAMERKQLKQDIALGFSVFLAIVVVLGIVVLMIMFS